MGPSQRCQVSPLIFSVRPVSVAWWVTLGTNLPTVSVDCSTATYAWSGSRKPRCQESAEYPLYVTEVAFHPFGNPSGTSTV